MSSTDAMRSHGASHGHTDGHDHGAHVGSLVMIYLALMVLLAATVIAAFLGQKMGFDRLNIVIAIAIAVLKATMVVWVFMHVKYGSNLVKLFAFSAVLFLGIMLALTFGDYLTRERTDIRINRSDTYVTEPHHRYPITEYAHPKKLDEHGNPIAEESGHE